MSEKLGRAFRAAFSRRSVQMMTGPRLFARGLFYAADGRVGSTTVTASRVKATVQGSSTYQVSLSIDEEDEAAYDCSCPVGAKGVVCKHAVAVALVVTNADEALDQHNEPGPDLRGYLAGLDHATLVDLLVEHAADDDLFGARLQMEAARAVAEPLALGVFRNAIDGAFVVDDFVPYREMHDYASGINAVLDSLQGLLDDGHADAVVILVEYAIDQAEDAVQCVDDSDGWMSGIGERLRELHLAACQALRPDPVMLARTLFDRELHSGNLEIFYGAVSAYADVLGAPGLAEYSRLAHAEGDALPRLGPADGDRTWSSTRFHLTKIMESLAELSGDVDAVVEVLAQDQSSAYQFVRIAEVLRNAGRYDDALTWAEKGLAMHGGWDSRLVDAAAEEYQRAGRGEEAVRVTWSAFVEAPTLQRYSHLAQQAQRAGLWSDWHDKAIDLLRTRIRQGKRQPSRRNGTRWPATGPDSSTLIEVLLCDGDVDTAWAEASAAGCRRDLWLQLARRREDQHPLDAIRIWREEIERLVDAKKNPTYDAAVELIARVGRLMSAAGQADDFTPYVSQVRTTHKAKRNLIKRIDQRNWLDGRVVSQL